MLGLLTLVGAGDGSFDEQAARAVGALAGQGAVAIENARLHRLIQKQARTDGLTGLANHREFQEQLGARGRARPALRRAGRADLLDLDDFKRSTTATGTWRGTTCSRPSPGRSGALHPRHRPGLALRRRGVRGDPPAHVARRRHPAGGAPPPGDRRARRERIRTAADPHTGLLRSGRPAGRRSHARSSSSRWPTPPCTGPSRRARTASPGLRDPPRSTEDLRGEAGTARRRRRVRVI